MLFRLVISQSGITNSKWQSFGSAISGCDFTSPNTIRNNSPAVICYLGLWFGTVISQSKIINHHPGLVICYSDFIPLLIWLKITILVTLWFPFKWHNRLAQPVVHRNLTRKKSIWRGMWSETELVTQQRQWDDVCHIVSGSCARVPVPLALLCH